MVMEIKENIIKRNYTNPPKKTHTQKTTTKTKHTTKNTKNNNNKPTNILCPKTTLIYRGLHIHDKPLYII